jgi:hypothetical protein
VKRKKSMKERMLDAKKGEKEVIEFLEALKFL